MIPSLLPVLSHLLSPLRAAPARLGRLALAAGLLGLACVGLPPQAQAAEGAADASAQYRKVDLPRLIEDARTPPGQRIILQPAPVSFVAEIHRLPERQTTDYLRKVLDMMKVGEAAEVGERIVVAYGDGQYLPLYIESAAARRLAESAQVGERRRFYALHVYNYSKGPALVVTSFGERE